MYYERLIDKHLSEWASDNAHKPLLLRGARQVGKSSAVRHLGEKFKQYIEINFEKQPEYKILFRKNLDITKIIPQISAMCGKSVIEGETLLFLDEIQACPEAIMSLRFFKEDMPGLHVIAAGSLLEFALNELPTYGVGRIHSMFMYPMTFDEFLNANGEQPLIQARDSATTHRPLPGPLHEKLISLLRIYMLVGGMPEVVSRWVTTHDFIKCQEVLDDIILGYEDDFSKYKGRTDPLLLRMTMRSAAVQMTEKFVYSHVSESHKTQDIKKAVEMLVLAGILIPVTHTNANGLPLGSEANSAYRKILLLDTGLTLRLLNMAIGDTAETTARILTANVSDLVNKGAVAEQIAGLEMLRCQNPGNRHDLFYWVRQARNSQAEIDYITAFGGKILPIEIKAGTQGGMKSLWMFMREKNIDKAVRCSLENFGNFNYTDNEAGGAVRHVVICPLYAVSMMHRLLKENG